MRRTHLFRALLALVIAGPLTGCLSSSVTDPIDLATVETTTFASSLNINQADTVWTRTASGLFYRVLTPAPTGAATVTTGQRATVKYTGWLSNGAQFESSTYAFTIGAGQAIPGWDIGIAGMKVGEKRRLLIPPALAYGAFGAGPIPPNSVLVFDVELTAIG